jgi:hypothetical protein
LVLIGGVFHGTWLEPSISRYYHTASRFGAFATRDVFVGGLIAAGFCLYLYKGFSNKENVALNLAGVCAALVAVLPPGAPDVALNAISIAHGASAVSFFAFLAYVSLVRSRDTLTLIADERQRAVFRRRYVLTGAMMIASPIAAVVLSFWLEPFSKFRPLIFLLETFAIWSFAAYWIVKTLEMRLTNAEERTLQARLQRVVAPHSAETESAPKEAIVPA